MYINDIHILYYVAFGLIGMIIGQFTDWSRMRLEEYKKIISKDFFKIYLKNHEIKYILMFITAISYIGSLYTFGLTDIRTYAYIALIPMLIIVIMIDLKKQVIPNRLTLSIFELGLIYAFTRSMININFAIDSMLGIIIGVVIFLVVTLIGGIFSGKETMGFGDVKLIGAIGLFMGPENIIAISILSFILGAIVSIVLLITKKKQTSEYIAFAPFIVIATLIVVFIPVEILLGGITNVISLIKK